MDGMFNPYGLRSADMAQQLAATMPQPSRPSIPTPSPQIPAAQFVPQGMPQRPMMPPQGMPPRPMMAPQGMPMAPQGMPMAPQGMPMAPQGMFMPAQGMQQRPMMPPQVRPPQPRDGGLVALRNAMTNSRTGG